MVEKNNFLTLSPVLLAGLFIAVLLLVPIVSAQVLENAASATSGFFSALFGDQELMTKLLFGLLLFMLLYNIVGVLFKGKWIINTAIAVIITFIAMWALPAGFITVIRDQYGVMGAAILSVIPFAIMLVFTVRLQNLLVSRILWVFFVVYYFALYIYRVFTVIGTNNWLSVEVIPYIGAIVAGILIFFFIGTIRSAIFKGEMGALAEAGSEIAAREELLHKLKKKELDVYETSK